MHLPPLLRAVRRFAAARPEARRFAARAWIAAPLVRASLGLVGLRSTLRWVEAAPTRGSARSSPSPITVDEGAALVRGAFRAHVVGGECLPQSVVQYLLHRRDGLGVRLVIGVQRVQPPPQPGHGGPIAAHAWVEAEAPPAGASTFSPIFTVGAGRRAA